MANRPSGNLQEGKRYFSGKHELYGFKQEVLVLPTGLAINLTKHHPGSVADIEIMHQNINTHLKLSTKGTGEEQIVDKSNLNNNYLNHWAILCDKGYQGAQEFLRVIHPKRKPKMRALSRQDELFNKTVASDRIIVENYFGRMCQLWNTCSSKFNWNETLYDTIMMVCVSLTNYHIMISPLRESNLQVVCQYKNKLYAISESVSSKQQCYKEKRSRVLQELFHEADDDDNDTDTGNSILNISSLS